MAKAKSLFFAIPYFLKHTYGLDKSRVMSIIDAYKDKFLLNSVKFTYFDNSQRYYRDLENETLEWFIPLVFRN